jgi:hypothetical protein
MSFNKKRACCCNQQPSSGRHFFEVISKVPIASNEKLSSKTTSFWFEADMNIGSNGFPDPPTQVIWEREVSDFPNANTNLTGDLTWADFVGGVGAIVYIPRGTRLEVMDGADQDTFDLDGTISGLLRKRGWYITTTTRILTDDAWESLNETKVICPLPSVSNTADPNLAINAFGGPPGWFFGSSQYDASPAIGPFTFNNLQWEVHPKVLCNQPYSDGEYFDFTANFPATQQISASGSLPIAYKTSSWFPGDPPGVNWAVANVGISASWTLTKTDEFFGGFSGPKTITYLQTSPDPSGDMPTIGSATVGGSTIEVKQPRLNLRGAFNTDIGGPLPFGFSCKTNVASNHCSCSSVIGWNMDGNRLACRFCDPNEDSVGAFPVGCSPANYDGSVLSKKNFFAIGAGLSTEQGVNTFGQDIVNTPSNFPSQPVPMYPRANVIGGIWASSLVTWGEATGSTVSFSIQAPSGLGLNSFKQSLPSQSCPGPISFYANETVTPFPTSGNLVIQGTDINSAIWTMVS